MPVSPKYGTDSGVESWPKFFDPKLEAKRLLPSLLAHDVVIMLDGAQQPDGCDDVIQFMLCHHLLVSKQSRAVRSQAKRNSTRPSKHSAWSA